MFISTEGTGFCPQITVITVVRNAALTLRRTIESVIGNLGGVGEYIVVDGQSNDGTVEILKEFSDCFSVWTSEPDEGIYDAMNKGLKYARGDWVLFLGADDELCINLAQILPNFTSNSKIYYGNVKLLSSGAIASGKFNRYRLMQENICHQAIFYPKTVYKNKKYSLNSSLIADHKYNIELWGAKIEFVHIPVVVSIFNDDGLSSKPNKEFERVKNEAIKESFGPLFYGIKISRTLAVRLLKRKLDRS